MKLGLHPEFRNARCADASGGRFGITSFGFRGCRAFTLIEIMVVVGLLAIIIALGAPTIYQGLSKEPMRRTLTGLRDAFAEARASAILSGKQTTVVFSPRERTFSSQGVITKRRADVQTSGSIPDSIMVEMLDINLLNYLETDSAPVRFFPNGTCDEFTLVLRGPKGDWFKIVLEPTTGIMTVGDVNR